MAKTKILRISPLFLLLPFLIAGIMAMISKSKWFAQNPDAISLGITFDMVLTAPILYLLLVGKTKIPKTTVVPFLIFTIVVCSFILPQENQFYLGLFKTWLLPLIELSVLSFVLYKVSGAIKQYKIKRQTSFDFFSTLKKVISEILPKALVMPVVMEISVFYYGFVHWKKRNPKENEFSYHKNSGTVTLLIAILLIIGIETMVFHIILVKWSIVAAWILTSLSVYSGIQIFGFLKSILIRPISIIQDKVYLRYGIMVETSIDVKNIDAVELSSKDWEPDDETKRLSFLGELEPHNAIIRLKKENTLVGLYGIKRHYKNIALYIDDAVAFKNRIECSIKETSANRHQ